jgi:serine/threonine protein kinase
LGIVKIADFGIAIHMTDKNPETKLFDIEGFTTWYKPPEVLMGSRNYDTSFDMWSFACVYGEMLNGGPMFPGQNDLHQVSKIGDLLGSPTQDNWPTVIDMPNHGKLIFDHKTPDDMREVFMDSSKNEVDLLISILKYDRRAKASDVLKMPYFQEYPPALPKLLPEERLADIEVQGYEDIFQLKSKAKKF